MGGHQIIGMAHHEPRRDLGCAPIRRLKPDERDPNIGTHIQGYFMENGYLLVRILKHDPIFTGLGNVIIVDEGYYCEIKEAPRSLILLPQVRSAGHRQ